MTDQDGFPDELEIDLEADDPGEIGPAIGSPAAEAAGPGEAVAADQPTPESAERVAAVEAFFVQLKKALKQIGLYRHNVAGYGGYLSGAYQSLSELTTAHGSIPLVVEQTGFTYLGQPVYREEASEMNLAFKFYRDGVRLLRFQPQIADQELLDFILICLTNFQAPENAHEDMVSLMWKRNFEHIEHVVMETFTLGSGSTEQAQLEVDQIVSHLYRGLSTVTSDSLQFARLSLDDLDIEIEDIEQVAGVAVRGEPVSPEEQIRFQHEAEQDLQQGNMRRLTAVLFRILEEELDGKLATALPPIFEQLLDAFLIQDNLAAVEWLLDRLGQLHKQPLPPGSLALVQHLHGHLAGLLCEEERIERIAELLESSTRPEVLAAVQRYLARLGQRALVPLLNALERLSRPEGRELICERLAAFGPDHIETYVARLRSRKANFIRDLLGIINRLQTGDKTRILAGLLGHPNLAIRLEALKSIGDGNDLAGSAYVVKALRDPDAQVRTTAARLLPNFDPGVALRSLLEIAQEPAFEEKPDREQAVVFASLAMLGTPPAIDFLRRQLRAGGVLQKKALAARKRNIVHGLVGSGAIAAFQLLKEELAQGVRDKELAALMERSCARLKGRLLAGGGRDGDE